jgi:hypothetical protein
MGSTSTRTFSTWAHLPHSNVRRPSTARGGKRRESDIADWQFGQRGRGIHVKSEADCEADMALPSTEREDNTLSHRHCLVGGGDETNLISPVTISCSVLTSARL